MNPMYTVKLVQMIRAGGGSSSGDKYLHRIFQMSFVPFPGLMVSAGCRFDAVVHEVAWDADEPHVILAYTKPDDERLRSFVPGQPWNPRPMQEIVQEYLDLGWMLDE